MWASCLGQAAGLFRSVHLLDAPARRLAMMAPVSFLTKHDGRQFSVDAMALVCPLSNLLMPIGLMALATLLAIVAFGRQVQASELAEKIRLCILLPQFVCLLGSTIIVIDSYELAKKVGMAPGDSGQLVGLNWLGAAVGFLTVWYALRQDSMIWRKRPLSICGSGLLINIIGSIAFAYAAYMAESGGSTTSALLLLKVARVLGGYGHGLVAQFMVVTIQSVTSKVDMGDQMMRVFAVNAVGVGSGPVLAASAHFLAGCPSGDLSLVLAPVVQSMLSCGSLLAVLNLFPDMSPLELPDQLDPKAISATENAEEAMGYRRILIVCCIVLFVLRNFVASGVEVGSSLLLERDVGMDRRLVGIAVGITFLFVVPAKLVHQSFKDLLSTEGWFRTFACVALAGTLLLYRPISHLVPGAAALSLLAGDALIFPAAFLADGISYGILMTKVLPDGSILDKNHASLFCNVLGMSLGRLSGPWLARYSLEALGSDAQNIYALGQTLACAAIILIFEIGVRPYMR